MILSLSLLSLLNSVLRLDYFMSHFFSFSFSSRWKNQEQIYIPCCTRNSRERKTFDRRRLLFLLVLLFLFEYYIRSTFISLSVGPSFPSHLNVPLFLLLAFSFYCIHLLLIQSDCVKAMMINRFTRYYQNKNFKHVDLDHHKHTRIVLSKAACADRRADHL